VDITIFNRGLEYTIYTFGVSGCLDIIVAIVLDRIFGEFYVEREIYTINIFNES
jgi:hypothetical protein